MKVGLLSFQVGLWVVVGILGSVAGAMLGGAQERSPVAPLEKQGGFI
jgi:hypothetical protein